MGMGRVATGEASSRDGLRCVTNGQDRNQDVPVRAERETADLCSAEGTATLRVVHFCSESKGLSTSAWWLCPAHDAPIHLVHGPQGQELSQCGSSLLIAGPRFVQALRKLYFVRTRQPLRASEDAFQIESDEMVWTMARGASRSFSLVAVVGPRTAEE